MPLAPGTSLGPYEITAPLGAGGMGEVYRARDTRLDRIVAIKILPQEMSRDPLRKQRFEREAKTISSLNHPHICVLHDVGSQDGLSYLVMECLEGETLVKRLEKGPLPLEQVLKYGAQIADALDKAHRSGVVHRDLKPGNIMLTATGAKLLDFGLAKPSASLVSGATLTAAAAQTTPVTQEGTIVGTFQYMSPEQIEGKDVDGRSDIFSLGAVLYEMLTGQRAFQGKSQLSVASAILEKEPAPINAVKPLTPATLDHAILRCLAKDPEERWQTARDLALELKWIGEVGSRSNAPVIAAGSRRTLSDRFGLPLVGVLLCALAAIAIFSLRRTPSEPVVIRSAILPPEDAEFFSLDIEGGAPAISPDGKLLASSVRDKNGTVQLWLRSLNSQIGRMMPGTEGAGHPFWSPDSRSIGFFAGGKLKRIDADGTSLQPICDVSSSPRGGSWSRDGVMLFAPNVFGTLRKVSVNGGAPAAISELDMKNNESGHRWPQFLPDGKHYLFFLRSFDRERTGVYEGALDSKEHHLVVSTPYRAIYVPQGFLLYMRHGTLIAQHFDAEKGILSGEPIPTPDPVAFLPMNSDAMFSVSDNGVLAFYPKPKSAIGWDLSWYDRQGKRIASIGQDFFAGPAVSPDGTKVAAAIFDKEWFNSDLWILDPARENKTRLTFGPSTGGVVWEPDGRGLIFSLAQNGEQHIFRKSLTGSEAPEVVLQTKGTIEIPGSICRDGRFLAYQRTDVGDAAKVGVWILPLVGDRKPFAMVQAEFAATNPRISPDCKWMAYISAEPGQPQIYVTSFPDGKRRYQATTAGGTNPRWRADGKELFFMLPDGKLQAVSVQEAGQELTLGSPHTLFAAHGIANRFSPYDAQADGQRFLISGVAELVSQTPLTLVANWDAELKQK